ncbi:MAG: single-stranded-DNA-specific exonuclease RecJ [Ruminococcaceae bacterium]|nr:single-stranded-DNA-specific exonuclease RecJ [Oscillospiraceae bacterium]
MKRWILSKYSKELVNNLAEECDVEPILALIAVARGYTDALALDAFLSCEDDLDDPFALADMDKAAECVNAAIEEGKLIAVYGDYDCDGVTATALLYTHLLSRGANVIYYIPNREDEGYGMNKESVDKLDGRGVGLIITVDNGINANEEIAYARSLGIDVVVTDHHIPAGALPDANAVVDPHRTDDNSEFRDLSGVGVAYKLVCAMENAVPEELLPLYGDLVALGTVADVMPLRGENRIFVREGLMYINDTARIGMAALITVAGLEGKTLRAGNLAFNLGPRINAAGRMGDASRAVKLLCSDNTEEAHMIASEIDAENAARQQIEQQIEKEAIKTIEERGYMHDRVIVCSGSGWHKGIVGIAAARLVERYGKPVIMLSTEGDISVGSGRSVDGFSLFDAINKASDFLIKFGGHELAAGLTVKTEDIERLRDCVNTYARKQPLCAPQLILDCKLRPEALSVELAEELAALEPFGKGNQNPLFGVYSLKIERITPIGNGKHLRMLFSRDGSVIQALMFGKTEENLPYEVGDTVDIAVTLEVNEFRGEKNLSVTIRDIRPSGQSEVDIETVALYSDFIRGFCRDTSPIRPTRDEIGLVYRCCAAPVSRLRVENKLIGRLSAGKILAACDILCELGLISYEKRGDNIILKQVEGVRSDLEKSTILCRLREGDVD